MIIIQESHTAAGKMRDAVGLVLSESFLTAQQYIRETIIM